MSGPTVVYVLRHYPQLSQTFVRNEVVALRASGVDVRVLSIHEPDLSVVDASWGGPSTVAGRLSRARALAVLAWWLTHHPRRLAAYATLVRHSRGLLGGMAWRQLPAVARGLLREEARVLAVHTHFAWSTLPAAPLLGVLLAAPASATVHARDIYVPEGPVASWLGGLDRLVTVCRHNVDRLHRDGLWNGPVGVVPCGVDVPDEAPPLDVSAHRVVTVGRLVAKKGVLTLVEAFARVVEEVPDATLNVVGDGPLRAEVEAAVRERGLTGHVRLLGALGHERSLAAIDSASVFALACEVDADGDSDALPVVLREAMARARPVVTTAVAGIPEVVDESAGWVVAPRDPEALARAVVEALTDHRGAAACGCAARGRVLAGATLGHTASMMRLVLGLGPVTDGS